MNDPKALANFKSMMIWALRRIFETYPDFSVSCDDLTRQLRDAWNEMIASGEIVLEKDSHE